MKKLTDSQKAKRIENITRWNAAVRGEVVRTESEIAYTLMALNALNTMRRNASDVQVAGQYLDAIANEARGAGLEIASIISAAAKGIITDEGAKTLAAFAIENGIEF